MITIFLIILSLGYIRTEDSCLSDLKDKTFEFDVMKTILTAAGRNMSPKARQVANHIGLVVYLTIGEDLSFSTQGAITIFSLIDSNPLFTFSTELKFGKALTSTSFTKSGNKCSGLILDMDKVEQVIQEEAEALGNLSKGMGNEIRANLQSLFKMIESDKARILATSKLDGEDEDDDNSSMGIMLNIETDGNKNVLSGSFGFTTAKKTISFPFLKEIKDRKDMVITMPGSSFGIFGLLVVIGLIMAGILVGYLLTLLVKKMRSKKKEEGLDTPFSDEHNIMLS